MLCCLLLDCIFTFYARHLCVSQTPPEFNWSIDEMASLLPVHIDPEEIQRQSFYLSQTKYVPRNKNYSMCKCETIVLEVDRHF